MDNVSKGKTWKDAALDRGTETISKIAFGTNQSGSGIRRKKRARKSKNKKKNTKRRKLDKFS